MNAVHGMPDWNIGASLVRNGRPVLAVVCFPVLDETFTATEGCGAFLKGLRLWVSPRSPQAGWTRTASSTTSGPMRRVSCRSRRREASSPTWRASRGNWPERPTSQPLRVCTPHHRGAPQRGH